MKKLIQVILLIDMIIFIIVGTVGLIAGWRTLYDYGQGLIYAGMLAIGLGILSVWGNYSSTRSMNSSSQFELSAIHLSARTPLKRVKDELDIVNQTFGYFLLMILVGLSVIAIGVPLQAIAAK